MTARQFRLNHPDSGVRIDKYPGVGTGSATTDTAAFNWAYAAAPAGSAIYIPSGIGTLNLNPATISTLAKPVAIVGVEGRPEIVASTVGTLFKVGASDVTLANLSLTGHATMTTNNKLVATTSSTAAGRWSGLQLTDLACARSWAALYLSHIEQFTITNCAADNITYAGLHVASGYNGYIGNWRCTNLTNLDGSGHSYGLTLTRSNGDLVDQPRSAHIQVVGAYIDGAPWEALDTHGGEYISFTSCSVRNANVGLAIVAADDATNSERYAPHHITTRGIVIESGVGDGTASSGVTITGAVDGDTDEYCRGLDIEATINGHGEDGTHSKPAFVAKGTVGMTVDIHAYQCANAGIVMWYENHGFRAAGTVVDPWTDSGTLATGLSLLANNNTGVVSNFLVDTDTKVATHVANRGIYNNTSATGNRITVGRGVDVSAASTPISGPTAGLGTTAQRPSVVAPGHEYLDTTLGKPIWWDGADWVDATGASV